MIGPGEDARTRAFVAGLPPTGAVVFVLDRLMQDFTRDLVRATHGIRGCEATSIFIAPTEADEAPFHIENRRPVFRHPAVAAARSVMGPPVLDDEPRVPRRVPDELAGAMVSLDTLRDWRLPVDEVTWTLPVMVVRSMDGRTVMPQPPTPTSSVGGITIEITRGGDVVNPYEVAATAGPFRVRRSVGTPTDVVGTVSDLVRHMLGAA